MARATRSGSRCGSSRALAAASPDGSWWAAPGRRRPPNAAASGRQASESLTSPPPGGMFCAAFRGRAMTTTDVGGEATSVAISSSLSAPVGVQAALTGDSTQGAPPRSRDLAASEPRRRPVAESGRTLSTAVHVLKALEFTAEHPKGVSVKALARALHVSLSSAYSLSNSLRVEGFLEVSAAGSGLYVLGPKVPVLYRSYVESTL